MNISCNITIDDIVEWNIYHYNLYSSSKKTSKNILLKLLILLLYISYITFFMFFIISFFNLNLENHFIIIYGIIFGLIVVSTYLSKQLLNSNISIIKTRIESLKHNRPLGIVNYYIDDNSFIAEDTFSKTIYKPNSIIDIIDTNNYFYIYVSSMQALIIPKRNNVENVSLFINKLSAIINTAHN